MTHIFLVLEGVAIFQIVWCFWRSSTFCAEFKWQVEPNSDRSSAKIFEQLSLANVQNEKYVYILRICDLSGKSDLITR